MSANAWLTAMGFANAIVAIWNIHNAFSNARNAAINAANARTNHELAKAMIERGPLQ